MILGALRPSEELGIVCASRPALDAEILSAAGIDPDAAIRVTGMEGSDEFRSSILEGKGWMDSARVEEEVVDAAQSLCHEHPQVRALLLECSDMPPYARAVQMSTGLPVWDFISLVNWIYQAVVQRTYTGFI